jgi:pimeloyl-ACP methyl ester carboxylesterase
MRRLALATASRLRFGEAVLTPSRQRLVDTNGVRLRVIEANDVGAQRAVWVGHDLGAMVAWSAAQLHPDRVAAVVGLSLPPMPRGQQSPTKTYRKMFGERRAWRRDDSHRSRTCVQTVDRAID